MTAELKGWQPDPFGLHELRFCSDDGEPTWLVSDDGFRSYDEPPAAPSNVNPRSDSFITVEESSNSQGASDDAEHMALVPVARASVPTVHTVTPALVLSDPKGRVGEARLIAGTPSRAWPRADELPILARADQSTPSQAWYRRWWWTLAIGATTVAAVTALILVTSTSTKNSGRRLRGTGNSRAANSGGGALGGVTLGGGYLATGSNDVIFIQWDQTGRRISGTAEVETLTSAAPDVSVSSDTFSVAGTIQGSRIALSLNDSTDVFGTVSNGSFTLNFPGSDGTLVPATFTRATATNFNEALVRLQGITAQANQNASNNQGGTIDTDAHEVSADIITLADRVATMNSDLGQFNQEIDLTKTDLTEVAQQEKTVDQETAGGADNGAYCPEAASVASESGSVDSDAGAVSSQAGSTLSDISAVKQSIAELQKDFSTLESNQSIQPSDEDNAPSSGLVNNAIAAASSAIGTAVDTTNGFVAQANSLVSQAHNDAIAAALAAGCQPPTTTETTISG